MKPAFSMYIGVDWATQSHRICVVDGEGEILREDVVEHSGERIDAFLQSLESMTGTDPQQVAVGIEVPHGPVVEAFLERNYAVFALNPKQLDRFRDRHSVAGAKDDRLDAYVLATSLRTDQHRYHRVTLDAPEVIRIRELARTEESLAADLRAGCSQLFQLLLRYYPQILQLSTSPDEPWIWALLETAPTPELGVRLPLARLRALLSKHHIRRWTAAQVREVLRQPRLRVAPGVAEAASEHVLLLMPQLRLLHGQRKQVAERIESLLAQMCASSPPDSERTAAADVALILSIPGVGRVIATTMIAEAGDPLRERNYHALRAYAGVAPVTKQSGKGRQVVMRYGCNHRMRNALYHWARTSLQNDPRSKEQYARLRSVGHSHGRALRGVADRLLTVLIAMLKSGRRYDPKLRLAGFSQQQIPA